jgi:hypothetical protein
MKTKTHIKLFMPKLCPQAAYHLADLVNELTHEVERYYEAEIRTYLYTKGREAVEMEKMEAQIEQSREIESESDPDDQIPF